MRLSFLLSVAMVLCCCFAIAQSGKFSCIWNEKIVSYFFLEVVCHDDDQYLPSEEDCHLFIQCANKCPITMSCPGGLVWNQALTVCDWPAEDNSCEVMTHPSVETTERAEIEK